VINRLVVMEDADASLLGSLRAALPAAALPPEVASARAVSAEVLVRACACCLRAISPGGEAAAPDALPADMSGRFRVGSDLAARIRRLGFRGDLGFSQLLYPSEADVRRLLAFLLDKLPKQGAAGARRERPATAAARAAAALGAWTRAPGAQCPPLRLAPFWTVPLQAEGEALLTSQAVPAARLAPSLLQACAAASASSPGGLERAVAPERLASELRAAVAEALAGSPALAAAPTTAAAASRAPPAPAPERAPALSGEARLAQLEEALAEAVRLQAEVAASAAAADERAAASAAAGAAAQAAAQAAGALTPQLEGEYVLRRRASALLADGAALEESERELAAAAAAARARMDALQAEWAAARLPLEERAARRERAAESARTAADQQLSALQAMRAEARQLVATARGREEEQRALLAQYESAPKVASRSALVKRILEIVKNVRKQEQEILRIASDTREVRREVNGAAEALGRAYALVDETVFRDARRDEAAREAYRLLAALHASFAALFAAVEETGRASRALRELEREAEALQRAPPDLPRVQADLLRAAEENRALAAQLGMVAA